MKNTYQILSINLQFRLFFQVFSGDIDRYTPVSHNLKNPIITRYIRINPNDWKSRISMRAEFYGCGEGKILSVRNSIYRSSFENYINLFKIITAIKPKQLICISVKYRSVLHSTEEKDQCAD